MVRSLTWMSPLALLLSANGLITHARLAAGGEPARIDSDPVAVEDDERSSDAVDGSSQIEKSAAYRATSLNPVDKYSEEDSLIPDAQEPADETSDSQDLKTELIKERFPSGTVHIEREVIQDANGNYTNHGMWKMWDERGNFIAQGDFQHGKRVGTWLRWYVYPSEAKLFSQMPYQKFMAPLASQATFKDGDIDGVWRIYDSKQQKISEWHYREGRRHGPLTWWYPGGRKMREVQYRDGEIDGQWTEWSPDGKVLVDESYQLGRKLAAKTTNHPNGAKKSQGIYLFAREIEQTPDNWWECRPQVTTRQGNDERHGAWTSWYATGQPQLEGNYEHDVQVGQFVWWHANGQKSLAGRYALGKQDGPWTWWHPNGQKSIGGHYAHGNPTGRWAWWKEDGKMVQSADLSHSEGVVVETSPIPDAKPQAQAKKSKPAAPVRR
jgi:antitoxin component YwqK of YwqJK toxin-antitoxin module